jgi:hypothetical protein
LILFKRQAVPSILVVRPAQRITSPRVRGHGLTPALPVPLDVAVNRNLAVAEILNRHIRFNAHRQHLIAAILIKHDLDEASRARIAHNLRSSRELRLESLRTLIELDRGFCVAVAFVNARHLQ